MLIRMEEGRRVLKILTGKPTGKRLLGRLMCKIVQVLGIKPATSLTGKPTGNRLLGKPLCK